MVRNEVMDIFLNENMLNTDIEHRDESNESDCSWKNGTTELHNFRLSKIIISILAISLSRFLLGVENFPSTFSISPNLNPISILHRMHFVLVRQEKRKYDFQEAIIFISITLSECRC